MSIEAYERLITDTQIDTAVAEAETEMEGGAVLMDAREEDESGYCYGAAWEKKYIEVYLNIIMPPFY